MENATQTTEPTRTEQPSAATPPRPPFPVKLTSKAVDMVKQTIERESLVGAGLRVAVVGGGCSGYQYSLDLEKESRPGDFIQDQDGVKLFCDPISATMLKGTEVDYVETMYGAGFSFKNPEAKHTCGCGSSFTA
jgi:iron-sulfur cluster assembly accessory protein